MYLSVGDQPNDTELNLFNSRSLTIHTGVGVYQ